MSAAGGAARDRAGEVPIGIDGAADGGSYPRPGDRVSTEARLMIYAIVEVFSVAGVEVPLMLAGLPLAGFILWDVWRQGRRGVERTG